MNQDVALKLGLLAIAAGAVYWFLIRPARAIAGAVGEAYSPGGFAYEAGNTIQDRIVPGPDSLGTWIYGLFNDDPDPTAPVVLRPTPYDYGTGTPGVPYRDPQNATATGGVREWPYRS